MLTQQASPEGFHLICFVGPAKQCQVFLNCKTLVKVDPEEQAGREEGHGHAAEAPMPWAACKSLQKIRRASTVHACWPPRVGIVPWMPSAINYCIRVCVRVRVRVRACVHVRVRAERRGVCLCGIVCVSL